MKWVANSASSAMSKHNLAGTFQLNIDDDCKVSMLKKVESSECLEKEKQSTGLNLGSYAIRLLQYII